MNIGSWWKKRRQRLDAEAMDNAEERSHESPEEQRISSGHVESMGADAVAARRVREGSIEDADRLGDGS